MLWRFNQNLYWCYDGSQVTYWSHSHWGETFDPQWIYRGIITDIHDGGVGLWGVRVFSQARFERCFGICTENWYPWVDQSGYGDGTYAGSAGTG